VRVRRERSAAIVGFAELVALDHRPHRPVEDQNATFEERAKFGSTIGLHRQDRESNERNSEF